MTTNLQVPTLALTYKRVKQPVVVRASELSNVPPARRRNFVRTSGTASVTGVVDPTTPVLMNATLPDIDTVIQGQRTKVVFKYVDSEKVQVLAMPLETAYQDANGKLTPIVYDMVLDFKSMAVIVNGVKVFDLEGVTHNQKVITGTRPEIYSNINMGTQSTKPRKGVVFPFVLKSLSFLFEVASFVIIYSCAAFVLTHIGKYAMIVISKKLTSHWFASIASNYSKQATSQGLSGIGKSANVQEYMTNFASTLGGNLSTVMSKGIEYVTYVPTKGMDVISGVYAAVTK